MFGCVAYISHEIPFLPAQQTHFLNFIDAQIPIQAINPSTPSTGP
jgi:hypothetical protein